ncbi:gamma-type small acid-soluble spore protein [Lysinibacillus parviboronicapiens]|uniref:gamma-type small acid-soluble spore protein n=1 Tax=Lysinibacillus parviboronicapiens TaxID=436516 RepID=UPI001EE76EDD|nr:gamma-type small acid-soluble spore protein [Lysinibacillus parviboronicapiens]
MNNHHEAQFTSSGTNINEVKRQNAASRLSYNEVKELLAKNGGQGTAIYSDTNVQEVKKENQTYKHK